MGTIGRYCLDALRRSASDSDWLKEDVLQILSEGQTIRHEQYGIGTVTESNTERTTIDFDNHGLKKFVTSIWIAELIGEPPADRLPRRRGRRKLPKKA